MSRRPRPAATLGQALWLGGLLVVLGGLFGMHGLDHHAGGPSVSSVASLSHATMPDATHVAHLGAEAATMMAEQASASVASAVTIVGGTGSRDRGPGHAAPPSW